VKSETAVVIKKGELGFIHNDELDFLRDMGKLNIKRLSNVEFNGTKQVWEVIYKGDVLSRHKSRKEAIQWEIKYFNARVMEGKDI